MFAATKGGDLQHFRSLLSQQEIDLVENEVKEFFFGENELRKVEEWKIKQKLMRRVDEINLLFSEGMRLCDWADLGSTPIKNCPEHIQRLAYLVNRQVAEFKCLSDFCNSSMKAIYKCQLEQKEKQLAILEKIAKKRAKIKLLMELQKKLKKKGHKTSTWCFSYNSKLNTIPLIN